MNCRHAGVRFALAAVLAAGAAAAQAQTVQFGVVLP
jgi:hypothetical protein